MLTVCWVRRPCDPREEPLLEAWEGGYSSVRVMAGADAGNLSLEGEGVAASLGDGGR